MSCLTSRCNTLQRSLKRRDGRRNERNGGPRLPESDQGIQRRKPEPASANACRNGRNLHDRRLPLHRYGAPAVDTRGRRTMGWRREQQEFLGASIGIEGVAPQNSPATLDANSRLIIASAKPGMLGAQRLLGAACAGSIHLTL